MVVEIFDAAAIRTQRSSLSSQPPRYSNLSLLASSIAEHEHEIEHRAEDPDGERLDAYSDGMSLRSLESNDTCTTPPTYSNLLPEGHSPDAQRSTFGASESIARFTRPPTYSPTADGFSATTLEEFQFVIRGGTPGFKSQSWATLKLYTPEAKDKKGRKHPRFFERENMFGCVELSLPGPHTVKNIKLVLKGTIITSAMDTGSVNFLEQTYTIWDRSLGDPRQPQAQEKFDAKLEGDYVFPFSIPFPEYVDLSTLEAVQADGQPVESQIQVSPLAAGLGGQIIAFPVESPLGKDFTHCHDARALTEPSSGNGITPFHINGSPPLEKVALTARTEPELEQRLSHITPFCLDHPSSHAGSPPSSVRGFEPGPSAISPYTVRQSDGPTPTSPSMSRETSRKGRSGSRWPFSKPASTNDVQKKRCDRKSSGPAPAQPGSGGHLHLFSAFDGLSSVYDTNPTSPSPASNLKSDIVEVLPQSFLERDVTANTKYELTLCISHGRFSSSDKVKTPVIYTRATIPPPMSWVHRDTYHERQVLPSPMENPGLWYRLPPVSIRGMLSQHRESTVNYTLFLANPLSYPRGTVIPCYLAIACDDISALNLLSNPSSPRVRLSRVVKHLDSAGGIGDFLNFGMSDAASASGPNRQAVGIQVATGASLIHLAQAQQDSASSIGPGRKRHQQVGLADRQLNGGGVRGEIGDVKRGVSVSSAVWWAPQESESDEEGQVERRFVRTLQGEIHLPPKLQPSCPFPLFNISYHVELLAPVSKTFEPNLASSQKNKGSRRNKECSERAQESGVYASRSVEITTDGRDDEPGVVSFTRPPSGSMNRRARRIS